MNKVILSGRLCKDIELRYTTSQNPVLSNTLAVKNDFKTGEEYLSEFINIKVWNNNAKYLSTYAKKGSMVLVEGRITNRSYDKQDGTKGYITEIVAEKIELLKNPNNETNDNMNNQDNSSFDDLGNGIEIDDDDLPF